MALKAKQVDFRVKVFPENTGNSFSSFLFPLFLISLIHLSPLTLKVESVLNWLEPRSGHYGPAGIASSPHLPPRGSSVICVHSALPPSSSSLSSTRLLRKPRKVWETHQGPTEKLEWRPSVSESQRSSHGCRPLLLITSMCCVCAYPQTFVWTAHVAEKTFGYRPQI